jgi:natural product biosynthesis luciferase-like monooxygenase protein
MTRASDFRQPTLDFSLFFFSSDGSTNKPDKYNLLLDCARFADAAGFRAIWTPERHFQEFGGLYPNPSVLAAALAMITKRIQIRAGSVVLPLHNPVRVAEEWSLVDNLSGGRVAISFASGWHELDFTLMPGTYARRREVMDDHIETVLRLWSGQSVQLTGVGEDKPEVRTFPRPVQQLLPFWLTGGSEATWEKAARLGANLLCLIRPSISELSAAIKKYRQRRGEYGHDPNSGVVTVMMHTFLHQQLDVAKQMVRKPLTNYLKSYIAQFSDRPQEPELSVGSMTADDLLDFAFERYFQQSSLIGTPEKCRPLLWRLADAGVNEIACLLDFGLPATDVQASLPLLEELRASFEAGSDSPNDCRK